MQLLLCIFITLAVPISTKRIITVEDYIVYNYHINIGIPEATRIRELENAANINGQRIVGGFIADVSISPYQAGLLIPVQLNSTSVCGASLISATRLLTAAHCDNNGYGNITVVLGSSTLFSGGTRIITDDIVSHPDWDLSTIANDIAIIRIPAVDFTDVIQSIALPSGSEIDNSFYGWIALASGFGATSNEFVPTAGQKINAIYLSIIANDDCANIYGTLIKSSQICTSGINGVGTCIGDSGGPLAVMSNDRYVLVGITSFGAQDCTGSYPSVYTRISSYITWIEDQ